jgi:hypothetical protein
VAEIRTDGGKRSATGPSAWGLDLEELRRRNAIAVGMDLLYLVTTGLFGHMFVRGFWPAVIAAAPLGAFLYFGWHSSKPFFLTQVVTIAVAAVATVAGVVSL